jgi:hypothetical protein
MDEDVTTNQTKWCLVEGKWPLEKFPCTHPCIERGLPEKIEGEYSLWKKKVPKIGGKCGVNTGLHCKEVVHEYGSSAFSPALSLLITLEIEQQGRSVLLSDEQKLLGEDLKKGFVKIN